LCYVIRLDLVKSSKLEKLGKVQCGVMLNFCPFLFIFYLILFVLWW
jgi:hypothetical protein